MLLGGEMRDEPGSELTGLVEVTWVLFGEEIRGEDEGSLDDEVGQSGERPPAHEQPVDLGQPAASPCARTKGV
jgi:hypothetical protein